MLSIIRNNLSLVLNIFLGLIIFVLLYFLTFVELKDIYFFNFSDINSLMYFIYFAIGIIFMILLKFLRINNNFLKEELSYTFKFIFLLCLFLLPSFLVNHNFLIENSGESNLFLRLYGKIAILYLALALLISPILSFVKNISFRNNLLLLRKVLGIISFLFFFKHALEYFTTEYLYQTKFNNEIPYLKYVYKNVLIRNDALSGIISGVLMLVLGLTSNKVSIKLFSGKGWKRIQSIVYPVFILSMIHVAFTSRFDEFYIILIIIVVTLRLASYIFTKDTSKGVKTTKYICIPCGYIYDESKGDIDGGLKPGTKFEDIPDDWSCPVCGVSKVDFEPYYGDEETKSEGYFGKVESYKMLTQDVLELSLKLEHEFTISKGQYAILKLKDINGDFSRAYSVVDYNDDILTFGIKLKDTGRGAKVLKDMKIGDEIQVKGIYGDFILKDNKSPKVFLATGTGLSPIMNMVSLELEGNDNKLFFCVQKEKDLFYLDKLDEIENLETNIFLSREETEKYNFGRIDLTNYSFSKDTEFYICGSPSFVKSMNEYLEISGYKNIYSEKFN